MRYFNMIFNELLNSIPYSKFNNSVNRYEGDRYTKYFSCKQQMITILYSQIKLKDSLRDIITGLAMQSSKLYHLGLTRVCRSTLSDANNRRNYKIFEELFYSLLNRFKDITPKHKFKFKNPLYTIDSTVIDLCLTMFPWAKFRKKKGGIKLHYRYDNKGEIPDFMVITDAKTHDIKAAKNYSFPITSDSIYAIDKAYIDFKWLYSMHLNKAYFVTRAKSNIQYQVIGQHNEIKNKSILSDEIITLTGLNSACSYPEKLRLIKYIDSETGKIFEFLTNNLKLAAITITHIYKSRWQIEIFFKWIKQNLKIKSFLGTSINAVMSQIWIAMCYYLIIAYTKYQTKFKYSLLELTRMIRETLFERIQIIDLLSLNFKNIHKLQKLKKYDFELTLF